MSLSPPRAPMPARGQITLLWSHALPARPRGLTLAREKGWFLAWDENHWVYILNAAGQRQAQTHLSGSLTTACGADDGSAFAAGGSEVTWLAPDLTPRWSRSLADKALSVAQDPFGQYLAVADAGGKVIILDRDQRLKAEAQSPRPLHHLAFIPAAPSLAGASDFGLVACLDLAGKMLWRDGLAIHTGSLAVTGDGETLMLACFTEGLQRYTLTGKKQTRLTTPEPCRLADLSFDGRFILAATLSHKLLLLDQGGRLLSTYPLDRSILGLALGPLGDYAAVALSDGRVIGLDLRGLTIS